MARFVQWWSGPTGLAVLLTTLNAAKPAAVDDTAYLLLARHIAAHPADPYGVELFWYRVPEPATHILLPPVLPYWLAAGVRLVGDNVVLLKLWLFPFALVLAHALAALLRRFAPGLDRKGLPPLVLGPGILPLFGVMLDVPALALGVAAVAVLTGTRDGPGLGRAVLAGLLAGLAVETKYSLLTLPAVLAWYALLSRRVLAGGASVAAAAAVFGGWELLMAAGYGESHFLHHAGEQRANAANGIGEIVREKWRLFQPMLGHLGGLGVGAGLVAAAAVGSPRWALTLAAVAVALGATAVALVPAEMAVLVGTYHATVKLDLTTAVFVTAGSLTALSVLAACGRLVVGRPRWDRDSWFLAGWLAVELVGYFALTPFPAGRRVIGLAAVGGIVALRAAALAGPGRVPGWVPGFGVAAGLALFGLDLWDALPEKVLAQRAARLTGPAGPHAVWYNGHWGFQYYCDREGMSPVVPSSGSEDDPPPTRLRAGDYLVFPVVPDATGFYRPYHGGARFRPDPTALQLLETLTWDDPVAGFTIPPFYGGNTPARGRPSGEPRLRVTVYRVTRDWVPELDRSDP